MHITIITIGSRGDIQPYLALAQGLHAANYAVRMITHSAFETLVHAHGIDFFPIDDDSYELFQSVEGRKALASGVNSFLYLYHLARITSSQVEVYTKRCYQACQDTDIIITTLMSFLVAYSIAEKLHLPIVTSFLQPTLLPTKFLPEPNSPSLPTWPPTVRDAFNYQSHTIAGSIFWQLFTPAVNRARQKICALPPLPRHSFFSSLSTHVDLILCAYSPLVIPVPDDWDENIRVCGFWTLDPPTDWQPDPSLLQFLDAGPAPVYIGFGSMGSYRSKATMVLAQRALADVGQRGILLVDNLQEANQRLSDTLYTVHDIPHEWLFPRMQAIVHHGGAGTTAASLRAGVPTITIPHIADQHFWGENIFRLGVGPRPLARRHLSSRGLAMLLTAVLNDPLMQQKAHTLGIQMRSENGVTQAIHSIQAHVPIFAKNEKPK